MTGADTAAAVAEHTARTSYGRLVAVLAAGCGDLTLAEDTLAEAFEQALRTWPRRGVPANPEGWLLTVARNRQRDVWKSAGYRRSVPLDTEDPPVEGVALLDDLDADAIPDRRLALLFVCAHPAVAAEARTPLMLQTVLGFDSSQVARAFAVSPAAMQQRLVRAKRRIRDARIPFVVPGRNALTERLPPVLEAIYGCHALTWREGTRSLAGEARYLAVTLATLLADEPEAWALAALTTLVAARNSPADTVFRPLDAQDPADWDPRLIIEGEDYLRRAERPGSAPGRFQLEAAIHAVHCARLTTGDTDWQALRTLYTALVAVAPTLGSRTAHAAVLGRTDSAEDGLCLLDRLSPERERFQPYHATRADLLARAGRFAEAAAAYDTAATLTDDPAVREFLRARGAAVRGSPRR
ncbi:RNA polymerase ECF-type sigma factor [Nocardia farcinica]|uniref:RNA polymerase sigma factor n=1 Tax=Nocardia farcinica TaxID=37329 RepID=UPI000DFC705C|nr:DUF6596 domain-containing protein [Nocardia farcinica]SUE30136.1 RNA polymerase ECF-type sigma factor [Nocardia farcinica]